MEGEVCCFHTVCSLSPEGNLVTLKVPVVQELARKGITELPMKYFGPKLETTPLEMAHEQAPPVIDMALLNADSKPMARAVELARLAKAGGEWGFFQLRNHGIDVGLMKRTQEVVKGFFGLSFEEKKKAIGSSRSLDNQGYGQSFVKREDQMLDWGDRLFLKISPISNGAWPSKPEDLREVVQRYAEGARKVGNQVLELLAEAIGLDKRSYIRHFDVSDGVLNLRANYYPPCPQPDHAVGLSPHADGGGLTVLLQDDTVEGLHVMKDGHWLPVPVLEDVLVVNIGDLLEIMSNGTYKSVVHRAVTNKEKERISIALFYNPPMDFEITSIASCEGDPLLYKKIAVKDYLKHYFGASPLQGKRALDIAKLHLN